MYGKSGPGTASSCLHAERAESGSTDEHAHAERPETANVAGGDVEGGGFGGMAVEDVLR